MPTVAPCGTWRSTITSERIACGRGSLGQVALDHGDVYWTEGRPAEAGRVVLVRRAPDGQIMDVTPPGMNVRSRVHEYGGGAFTVGDGTVVFTDFADGRLWRQEMTRTGAGRPQPLTPDVPDAALRHADPILDLPRRRVVCVQEDHRDRSEAENRVVEVLLDAPAGLPLPEPRVLVSGHDFFSNVRLDPDGRRACWLAWDHPNMPWDGTTLWVADVAADGSFVHARAVAGGPEESIFQPEWSPTGILHFVSDRTDWWNLYRLEDVSTAGSGDTEARALAPLEAEFGQPQWVFGTTTYAFAGPERILCRYTRDGIWQLAVLDELTGSLAPLDLGGTAYGSIAAASDGRAVLVSASPVRDPSVVMLDTAAPGSAVVVRTSAEAPDERLLSRPEPIEFPTGDGLTAHALFYPPTNPEYVAPAGETPPLLVNVHGGPTSMAGTSLDLELQFWTSRGFAVLDVNYGGSSGYGRRYRRRLEGRWGIVDLDDTVNAARHVAALGRADPSRLVIHGGSAGGYTTLCAVTFRDAFRAGGSYFGIGDLEVFVRETHKFESRYMDRLLGPYPAAADVYRARSPIHFVDRIACPVILLQGLDDRVVPPDQAELMFDALRRRGIPVAYLPFEGEGHGFRRAENIQRSLEAELSFYGRVLGFAPADELPPLRIENL
jgi:dipeptidyl aminopeptidase/acylaminoacyl peptidase